MSSQTWVQTLISSQVDGAALSNSTAATSILPGQAKFTLPANFWNYAGQAMRIKASGRISTVTTTPGNLTLDIRHGSVIVFTTGAMSLNTTAQTNATWLAEFMLTARAIGSSTTANLMGTGFWSSRAILGSAAVGSGGDGLDVQPDTAPAVGTGFDSTVTNVLDMFATFSVANASNSIQLHQFFVESLN